MNETFNQPYTLTQASSAFEQGIPQTQERMNGAFQMSDSPIAQGTEGQTSQSMDGQEPQAPQPAPNDGFQKRIDQLTAEKYAMQEQANQMQAQYLEVMARMTEQRMAQPASVAPPPQMDPQLAQALDYYLKQHLTPLQQQLQQAQAMAAQTQARMAFQEQAQGENPAVVKKAQELLADWRRKGLQGWTEQDALVYARGVIGVPAPGQANNRDALGRFNANAQGGQFANSPPPSNQTARPVELDRSSTDPNYYARQAALLEKNLGDQEF